MKVNNSFRRSSYFKEDEVKTHTETVTKHADTNKLCNSCRTIKSPLNNVPNVLNNEINPLQINSLLSYESYESINVESSDNESIISSDNITLSRGNNL